MLRTIAVVERNIRDLKLSPLVVAAATATDIFPDTTGSVAGPQSPLSAAEIVYIEIFNCGGNNVYFAYGRNCDNITNFNGYIIPGQAMSINTRERLSVYSVGGSTLARTVLTRVTNGGN